MSNLVEISEISSSRKNNIFKYEISNIEELYSVCANRDNYKKTVKDGKEIRQYRFLNFWAYFVKDEAAEETIENNKIFITKKEFLEENDSYECEEDNIELKMHNGMWISIDGWKIEYNMVWESNNLLTVEVKKEGENTYVSYFTADEKISEQVIEKAKKVCTVLELFDAIEYSVEESKEVIEVFKKVFDYEKIEELENKVLIEENQELYQKINDLNNKLEEITNKVNEISLEASRADKETKKTIEEMHQISKETLKIKRENESLKTNIFNIRNFVTKRCAFIPIIGRIIIKEMNKELGSKALPSGE